MTNTSERNEANLEDYTNSSFIQNLARYYSEFLATDFKKGSTPKRIFVTKDRKGRPSGVALSKYPELLAALYKKLKVQFKDQTPLKVKHQKYKSKLAPVVRTAIDKSIKGIQHDKLTSMTQEYIQSFKEAAQITNADHELELEQLMRNIERALEFNVVAPIIEALQPVFEKNAANIIDHLLTAQEAIIEQILDDIDEALPIAFHDYFYSEKEDALDHCILDYLKLEKIETNLQVYFDGFAANDFFSELRDISGLEQLNENLEYYLYFGELIFKNHNFPIFFMPINISLESNEFHISFEPRLLVNKKAVDYVSRALQERSGLKSASVVGTRIHYVEESDILTDLLDELIQPIIATCQFEGSFLFSNEKTSLKDSNAGITNSLNISLFDKSDESMLTDYEELLDRLAMNGENLIKIVNDLVVNFLYKNPKNLNDSIEDWWDETPTSERLVFETPIPLADEQRKILEALNHHDGRFVSVEGPPGTGKSHTISAIAFEAILEGQSILILSDTKEALDVVENKLNETLGKVRPSDDFVNPILRLGRTGSNFNKVTKNKVIETLRVQSRAYNKSSEKKKREEQYELVVGNLKKEINERIKSNTSIDPKEIFEYESEITTFANEWAENLDWFVEFFDDEDGSYYDHHKAIAFLSEIREECLALDNEIISISRNFGDDASALSSGISFVLRVNERTKSIQLFKTAPHLRPEKIQTLEITLKEIRNAKGFFGYFFAGKKLTKINDDLRRLIGYSQNTSDGNLLISEIEKAKDIPSENELDPNSKPEKKVLKWIQQTSKYNKHKPEIKPQFEIGKYLKFLDESCNHPAYRVDFLLRFSIDGKQRDIIIEYDGFEYHFDNKSEVESGNWQYYQREADIERDHILEGYGYKTLRINRFVLGSHDPVETLDSKLTRMIEAFSDPGDALTKKVVTETLEAHRGLSDGSYRTCKKCGNDKPFEQFEDINTVRGYRNHCETCKVNKFLQ